MVNKQIEKIRNMSLNCAIGTRALANGCIASYNLERMFLYDAQPPGITKLSPVIVTMESIAVHSFGAPS